MNCFFLCRQQTYKIHQVSCTHQKLWAWENLHITILDRVRLPLKSQNILIKTAPSKKNHTVRVSIFCLQKCEIFVRRKISDEFFFFVWDFYIWRIPLGLEDSGGELSRENLTCDKLPEFLCEILFIGLTLSLATLFDMCIFSWGIVWGNFLAHLGFPGVFWHKGGIFLGKNFALGNYHQQKFSTRSFSAGETFHCGEGKFTKKILWPWKPLESK